MTTIDYRNKVVLAPMVRAGTFPLRALCLEYGADLVYTEEIIDRRIIGAVRTVNAETGAIEYIKTDERGKKDMVFSTFPWEKAKCVFQLGTPNAELALQAAQTVLQDVAAIDINMGCPLNYSVAGGMGSALLSKPEVIYDILKTLKTNLPCPVTCKIRLLNEPKQTVDLVKMIESTGVDALGFHCRYVHERPNMPSHWDQIRFVVDSVSIPVIANGDIYTREDITKIKELSGCSSVMLARGALKNPSVFRAEGLLPMDTCVKDYLRFCCMNNNHYVNTKWVLCQIMNDKQYTRTDSFKKMQSSKTLRDICLTYGVEDVYDKYDSERAERRAALGPGPAGAAGADDDCDAGRECPEPRRKPTDEEREAGAAKRQRTEATEA